METAPSPEPAQLVHSLSWAGQADWVVTSLPQGSLRPLGRAPNQAWDSSSVQLSGSESKRIVKRKLVSIMNGETEAEELGYLDLSPL